jgi:hypothetical protein
MEPAPQAATAEQMPCDTRFETLHKIPHKQAKPKQPAKSGNQMPCAAITSQTKVDVTFHDMHGNITTS